MSNVGLVRLVPLFHPRNRGALKVADAVTPVSERMADQRPVTPMRVLTTP